MVVFLEIKLALEGKVKAQTTC